HAPQDGGVTVASLFYLARLNGWLSETGIEIDDEQITPFYAQEVGDFLLSDDAPKKALVMSNTGTGKTLGAIAKLKALGIPKAVFFAPSVKLCVDLSTTLTQHGVDNTLYIEGSAIKSYDEFLKAQVLVTTLQSFASRLAKNNADVLKTFAFVAIDESDELISSFVRADVRLRGYGSHIHRSSAQHGIVALSTLIEKSEYCYLLDGTATRISLDFANHSASVPAYRNTYKRDKAPVTRLHSRNEAHQKILESISSHKHTVVCADTRKECEVIVGMAQKILDEDQIILFTRLTRNEPKVKAFFEDVDKGAKDYRLVVYNSSMGSGVSITSVEPANIIQIVTGTVSPRKALQMINRYRQQGNVYAYVADIEHIYHDPLNNVMERIRELRTNEVRISGL
ncbi:MAG TPA: DEAD/DEAH box helicase family protein, partial [Candidatus Paceibacterota bacterium]|nr:DEAD/DEAH box helicase family protein [Candidatus Paceibacterota bacterium]